MRALLYALAILSAALAPARADTPQACIALWDRLYKANRTQGIAQQDFMAACLAHTTGGTQPSQITAVPQGATGRCRDGTYTTATVPLAGCSRHGVVAALTRP